MTSAFIEQMWESYSLGRINAFRDPLRPRIRDVLFATSKMTGVPVNEILADRRTLYAVSARHKGIYVAHCITRSSTTQIGRVFGGRDHTTILHAVRKIKQKIEAGDEMLRADCEDIEKKAFELWRAFLEKTPNEMDR